MEGPLGMKMVRVLDYDGIHLNDLNPCSMRMFDGTAKSEIEFMMYEAGITVQDLRKGSYYESLEAAGEDADEFMRNLYKEEKEKEDAGALKTIPAAAGPEFFKGEAATYNKEDDDEKYLQELLARHNIPPKNDPWKHINGDDDVFFTGPKGEAGYNPLDNY